MDYDTDHDIDILLNKCRVLNMIAFQISIKCRPSPNACKPLVTLVWPFLFVWSWPWPDDLDILPRPRCSEDVTVYQKRSL